MALRYLPVTEDVTPPITPPRTHAVVEDIAEDTPSPVQKPGCSQGRCTWRAPQRIAPGVGTRSKSRLAELEKTEAKQAMAAHAEWPPSPDPTKNIQRMTRDLRLCDVPRDAHKELQRIMPDLPDLDENQNINLPMPPAAGLRTQHQDIFLIPPPRVVGGARGISAPVSTATLGLIHRHAAQLREDPSSMTSQSTRRRVCSAMRLIRTGMLGLSWLPSNNGKRRCIAKTIYKHCDTQNIILIRTMNNIYVDKFMTICYLAQVAPLHFHCIIIHFIIILCHISVLLSLHYCVISLHSCSHTVYLCIYV